MVDYIKTPTAQKVQGVGDPYFYGMDEASWVQDQMNLDRAIRSGSLNARGQDRLSQIVGSDEEAKAFINYSRNPRTQGTRHMAFGVPYARVNEQIYRDALKASGTNASFNNANSHLATDLSVMVGKLKQFMDVQNRIVAPGQKDMLSLGVFQGLRGPYERTGTRTYTEASPGTELQDIIESARQLNANNSSLGTDKLYQERGIDGIAPDMVKDYLATGMIDSSRIRNLTKVRHGNYNPTTPSGIEVVDMNALRDNLYPMSKREFEGMGGTLIKGATDKLKLQLPMERVLELGRPQTQMVSDEVNEVLGALYSGRL